MAEARIFVLTRTMSILNNIIIEFPLRRQDIVFRSVYVLNLSGRQFFLLLCQIIYHQDNRLGLIGNLTTVQHGAPATCRSSQIVCNCNENSMMIQDSYIIKLETRTIRGLVCNCWGDDGLNFQFSKIIFAFIKQIHSYIRFQWEQLCSESPKADHPH